MEKTIKLTPEEGMLIDWVLTMHSYDSNRLGQLEERAFVELRKKVAPIILETSQEVTLESMEIGYLLITVPITFRFGKEDVGFSLKRKLLATLFPPQIDWKIVEASNEDSNSASSDSSQDKSQDSS